MPMSLLLLLKFRTNCLDGALCKLPDPVPQLLSFTASYRAGLSFKSRP